MASPNITANLPIYRQSASGGVQVVPPAVNISAYLNLDFWKSRNDVWFLDKDGNEVPGDSPALASIELDVCENCSTALIKCYCGSSSEDRVGQVVVWTATEKFNVGLITTLHKNALRAGVPPVAPSIEPPIETPALPVEPAAAPIPVFEGFEAIALRNMEQGYIVFPIRAANKLPHIKGFQKLELSDMSAEQIHKWATQWPDANVGLLATRDGELFIDEDSSPEFREGYEAFANESFPVSRTTQSRPGHRQSHWKQTDYSLKMLKNIKQDQTKDGMFSLRFDRMLVVGEGSQHKTGSIYGIYVDSPAIPIPDKLVDYMLSLVVVCKATKPKSKTAKTCTPIPADVAEEVSSEPLTPIDAAIAPPGFVIDDAVVSDLPINRMIHEHGRNDGVSNFVFHIVRNERSIAGDWDKISEWAHYYNEIRCVPPLSEAEVNAIVDGKKGKGFEESGANALIFAKPAPPAPAPKPEPEPAAAVSLNASYPSLNGEVNPNHRPHTDLGNAERLVDAFSEDIKFCNETGQWYIWNNVKWVVSGKTGPQAHMQAVVRAIRDEIKFIPEDYDEEKKEKLMEALLKWGRKSQSNSAIMGAINQARALPLIQVKADQFDANADLLNLKNGTLNLKTGEFRPHDRKDLLTKVMNVSFDPSAIHPLFTAYLDKCQPDKDTQRFLAQAAGYSLTGSTAEDCLFLCIGKGRNGKGVFLQLLKWMLGDYALQASFDSFVATKNAGLQIRSDIARMEGARMIISSENEEDQHVAESLLKTLTGSDTIVARKPYQCEREYEPQFKLWFGINNAPRITGVDDGIWSRIYRIPWNVFIPPEERILGLRQKIANTEASGVLNWMIAGLKDYQQNRLVPSAEIRKATEEYRHSSDVIHRFLEEKCVLDAEKKVLSSQLYSTYKDWCHSSGEYWVKEKMFREYLMNRRYRTEHTETGSAWRGIGLKPVIPDVIIGGAR